MSSMTSTITHSSLCLALLCMLRIDNNCAMHRAHSRTNFCWANQRIFVLHFDAPCVQCRGVRLQTSAGGAALLRTVLAQYVNLSRCRNTAAWGTMSPNSPGRRPRKENDGRTLICCDLEETSIVAQLFWMRTLSFMNFLHSYGMIQQSYMS